MQRRLGEHSDDRRDTTGTRWAGILAGAADRSVLRCVYHNAVVSGHVISGIALSPACPSRGRSVYTLGRTLARPQAYVLRVQRGRQRTSPPSYAAQQLHALPATERDQL